jgi:hypothetical protein
VTEVHCAEAQLRYAKSGATKLYVVHRAEAVIVAK